MTELHGSEWNDVVSADDAQRYSKPKRHVSKNDLAVLLKILQFRKMKPWSDLADYQRVRVLASELTSVRNLHAHSDECVDELSRLIDTSGRLLRALGLTTPIELEQMKTESSVTPIAPATQHEQALIDPDADISIGESGDRLAEIWSRGIELNEGLGDQMKGRIRAVVAGDLAADQIMDEAMEALVFSAGEEVVDLIAETYSLEVKAEQPHRDAVRALALSVRCQLSEPLFAASVLSHKADLQGRAIDRLSQLVEEESPSERKARDSFENDLVLQPLHDRLDMIERVVPDPVNRWDNWREVTRLAQKLNDGDSLPNLLILNSNMVLLSGVEGSDSQDARDDELTLVRDSIVRSRMLASQRPGSLAETTLVMLLRREGRICADAGKSEEAIQAFARADEIVDRYPGADPDLR